MIGLVVSLVALSVIVMRVALFSRTVILARRYHRPNLASRGMRRSLGSYPLRHAPACTGPGSTGFCIQQEPPPVVKAQPDYSGRDPERHPR